MKRVLFLSIVFSAFAVNAFAANTDCALKPITSIDLIGARGGPAIIPVTLNGRRAGLMLRLDMIASVIDPVIAEEWSLPLGKVGSDLTYGDLKIKHMAQYQDLAIGDMKYPKGFFLVAPEPLNMPPVDGVKECPLDKKKRDVARYKCDGVYPIFLGADVLQQLRLYFATKEGKLYFTSADAGMKE
jgi:hypothetical protein